MSKLAILLWTSGLFWTGSLLGDLYRADSQWTITPSANYRIELQPHERTRPKIVGKILFTANLAGEVSAVHKELGYVIWKRKLAGGVEGAFTYGRSKVFVGDLKGNLYALNARDGSISWQFKIQGEWLSPPALLRDRVFVTSASNELFALSEKPVSKGKPKVHWQYARRGDEKMTVRGTSGPSVYGGEVYAGFADGYVVGLSARSGKVIWEKGLRRKVRFYDVDMVPYVDRERVIIGTFDGSVYSLNRLTGDTQWVIGAGSYGGFLVEGNRVYFSGLDKHVYAVNKKNGAVIWRMPFEKGVGLTPVRVGNHLVVTTSGDPIYLLDPKDGKKLWEGSLGTGSLAAAASDAQKWFYVLSNYGILHAFKTQKYYPTKKGPQTLSLPSALRYGNAQPKSNPSST